MSTQEYHSLVFQTLEGHLRAILGTLTVEEINNDRQSFAQKLTSEAASDLEKMGIGLDALTIQEISDEEGYLDALGKGRTAEVKRDAEISEAEAKRDSKIKASVALQEGEKVRLSSEADIALSTRDIIHTVSVLRDNGVEFLVVPDSYYESLWERVGQIDEDTKAIADLNILVDRDDKGYLLQIFTKPVEDRPTLFYEIIQRRGHTGFGEGNFQALFDAIERDQKARGYL